MRSTLPLLVVLGLVGVLVTASACHTIECGPGTIDRGGECEPADLTVGNAKCGPNTVLRGDQCVPEFSPTECDPDTTEPETDSNGVTKCIGTGGGGCSAPLPCPNPASGKQTVCGRIYNFVDNTPFVAGGATGAQCMPGATDGPCALKIVAINPTAGPLTTGPIYIDDCGRYRVPDIEPGTAIGVTLNIDDLDPKGKDITVLTHVGVLAQKDGRTKDLEAWVVSQTLVASWAATASELSLTKGIYAGIFRAHACNPLTGECPGGSWFDNQAGVKYSSGVAGKQYFFTADLNHEKIDITATVTSSNGTALTTIQNLDTMFSGDNSALPDTCKWESRIAVPLFPNSVFFQVFRPVDNGAQKCTQ